ncbi:MAG: hypothetical protein ABIJ09_03505 [Pseudomonadota bacterium]
MTRARTVWGTGLLVPALVMLGAASTAHAITGNVDSTAQATKKFPVSATLVYDNSVGIGTFVANEYARNPSWSMSLSLRPSLTLWEKLRLTLRADVVKNMTTSFQGNANADASGESYVRQMTVSDLMLIAAYPQIYKEPITGISIGASLTGYAPVSMLSRATNQVVALRPGLAVNWAWEGLSLDYAFYFKKNFQTTTNVTHNLGNLPNSLQFRPGGPEDLGNGEIALGDVRNTSHLVYNYVGAGYTFFDVVTASASLFVINTFKYTQPLSDEYSSPYARAAGQIDSTWGTIDITYQPWEHLAFSAGMSSLQPAFTADNKYLRFPFFDFVSTADNYTAFYFDVMGTF